MTDGPIVISYIDLALTTVFVLAAGLVSVALSLGLLRSLLIGTIRTFIQLLALGFVLRWVFDWQTPILVMALYCVMLFFAVHTVIGRTKGLRVPVAMPAFVSMFISGFTVTLFVTGVILRVDPWYDARYLLPIGGMVLGNALTGVSLSFERLFSDLDRRSQEVTLLVSLGGTPWEASLESVRASVSAGMIPTINAMNSVGIVSIPGMMTGQVIAGADPAQAAKYQIVVMLMLTAATAVATIMGILIAYRRAFTVDGRLLGSLSISNRRS